MKILIALGTALLMGSTAYAQMPAGPQGGAPIQSSTGNRHMFEFNADSLLNGVLSFSKSKSKGANADNDTRLDLRLNYAYSIPMMPRLQVGGGINYLSGQQAGRGDTEDYGFNLAAYLNQKEDLQNSAYISAKWGVDWAHTYGGTNAGTDELTRFQLAVGQRMDLTSWGIKHLVYTPEIAFVNEHSTTGAAVSYAQSLQFRFLQFSVFF